MSHRVPVIVTNLIDSMTKQKDDIAEKFGDEAREELKKCIAELSKLKYELQTDKKFLEVIKFFHECASCNFHFHSLALLHCRSCLEMILIKTCGIVSLMN